MSEKISTRTRQLLTDVYVDTFDILTTTNCDYPHVCAEACGVAASLIRTSTDAEMRGWAIQFIYGEYVIGRPGQRVAIKHPHHWLSIIPGDSASEYKFPVIFDPTHIQFEDLTDFLVTSDDAVQSLVDYNYIYNIKDIMMSYRAKTGKVIGECVFSEDDLEYDSYRNF